ncbi:hypothetical protein VP01_360g2 [Puccinia sorghi]|uniref:Uncharacterized protein n=1 Tax=Puccinia sorghi TaxID=27349 RepID=A0A0L6UV34_9BASI|nr:hypothetical protein VP01_360g2 [Puccinia sorghi]
MDKQLGFTVGAMEGVGGGYKSQQMDETRLARTMSGSEYGFKSSSEAHTVSRLGDPSLNGSSTLASGPVGHPVSQNGSGLGKLIRRGTGTILSHNSGSSRNSYHGGNNPVSGHHNISGNPPSSDRRSILGIRFGSRQK